MTSQTKTTNGNSIKDNSVSVGVMNRMIIDINTFFCEVCQEQTSHLKNGFCEKCQMSKEERDEWNTPEGYFYNRGISGE